jgi:hypothetical protein
MSGNLQLCGCTATLHVDIPLVAAATRTGNASFKDCTASEFGRRVRMERCGAWVLWMQTHQEMYLAKAQTFINVMKGETFERKRLIGK